ncbi:uncharacterized protein LOC133289611 [Gastrolobium bilobum]|uniref:uncharacterized protein LOC133289611 n=1 Tax=Gastrolobium bilobum TaxID=150636 RepID=UPI002AB2812C|nr:uncharacterized protein LOC133289611 [Gastrolobium bilobum]
MAPRRRQHKKNNMAGNSRMDAALDAMRPFGFDERLVQETVGELLEVYEGTQGWIFIEEASYKLLIETLLGKQSSGDEKIKEDPFQDNARNDGDGISEASSSYRVAQDSSLQITGIPEVGSSSLVAQDSEMHTSDGLDPAPQTIDQASLGNLETDVKDSAVSADRGGRGQGSRVESKNELKPADNVEGSNYSTFVGTHMIDTSEAPENLPCRRRKPCYGWIGGSDDEVELIRFPLPPLPEHIERLIRQSETPQSGRRRRRLSRWDEKPHDM